jgi:hypothetical protein
MQKILVNGTSDEFHRKFGKLTEGKRGVYIWGFAKELCESTAISSKDEDPMKQFEVQVTSKNIGIYYIGKVESKNLNIFERIMHERANLFGGFFPIFEWDTYFHDTPMLQMLSQLRDEIARKERPKRDKRLKKHMTNLDRYEKCSDNIIFNIDYSTLLYSNAYFNQNNIFDIISTGNHFSPKLINSLKNMSEKFIFTWIEIDTSNQEDTKPNIKKLESELINYLGVNVLGIGSKYALSFHEFDSLDELNVVEWKDNLALKERINHINKKSIELKNSPCGCFK